jgi:hypothetical protein
MIEKNCKSVFYYTEYLQNSPLWGLTIFTKIQQAVEETDFSLQILDEGLRNHILQQNVLLIAIRKRFAAILHPAISKGWVLCGIDPDWLVSFS